MLLLRHINETYKKLKVLSITEYRNLHKFGLIFEVRTYKPEI